MVLRSRLPSFLRVAAASLVLAATGSLLLNAASAAPAFAKCQPSLYHTYRTNNGDEYQDGLLKYASGSVVGGIYAEIRNYSPWVDPNPDPLGFTPASTAWVMLQGNGAYWAQVGWLEIGGGHRWTFTQTHTPGTTPITHVTDPRMTDHYTYYTVLYNAGPPAKLTFQYRDSSQGTPTTIEAPLTSWVPYYASMASEITTYSNQMAGTSADTEGFYDAHWYVGSWSYTNFDSSSVRIVDATTNTWSYEFDMDGPYYGYQTYTWDGAC